MKSINTPTAALFDAFAAAFAKQQASLSECGRLLVDFVDSCPTAWAVLEEKYPGVSRSTFEALLRIGRGEVDERLWLADAPGAMRLRNCDIATQKHYLAEPADLLVVENGRHETLKVSIWDLSSAQAKQLFHSRGVRSVQAQRAWLEQRKPVPQVVTLKKPYTVHRGKVRFVQPCELTIQQLAIILSEASA